jgi:hypothetical protein
VGLHGAGGTAREARAEGGGGGGLEGGGRGEVKGPALAWDVGGLERLGSRPRGEVA